MRRVFGIETEYGIALSGVAVDPHGKQVEQAARDLFASILKKYRSTNVFLPNGGRLYLDVGSHPEYATAECDHLSDLIAQEQAGDRLLAQMAAETNQVWAERGQPGKIHLIKNNLDSVGNPFGCHENYLVNRAQDFRKITDPLITFFVTRQIVIGAGFLAKNGEYGFSARSETMNEVVSAATTRSRPIINTRDEPLAESTHFRRLHVISGDSNRAPTTTWLKVGMTQALLDALDAGLDLQDLALAAPTVAIQAINRDLTGRTLIELADGSRMTVIEIQRLIYQRVLNTLARACPAENCTLASSHFRPPLCQPDQSDLAGLLCAQPNGSWQRRPLPTTAYGCIKSGIDAATAHEVMKLWDLTLTAIETGNWDPIATKIDWVIKYRLFAQVAEKRQLSWDSPQMAHLDLAYHDITAAGLMKQLVAAGLMEEVVSAASIEQALTTPPQSTRARLRGEVIAAAHRHRRDLTVDWLHLRLDESKLPTITLNDPLETKNEQVTKLLAEITTADSGFWSGTTKTI